MDGEKVCIECKKLQHITEFSIYEHNNDGRKAICKDCFRIKSGGFSEIESQKCATCCKIKSKDKFNLSTRAKGKLSTRCKECSKINYARIENGTQICISCQVERDVSEFHTHKYSKNGIATVCKICEIINIYGISYDEYISLKESQNHKCKICNKQEPEIKLHLDHCHSSGTVRGFLCRNCNVAIGLLQEDIEICKSLVKYLEENNNVTP